MTGFFASISIGWLTAVSVVVILALALWPRIRAGSPELRKVGPWVLAVLGVASVFLMYRANRAAMMQHEADTTTIVALTKEKADLSTELTATLSAKRVGDARLATFERTATEQKQRDAERAASLEGDLQKAMADIGALYAERNGVIELVLKDAVVTFDTDQSTLQCASKERLSRVLGAISRVLDIVDSIQIIGHTDLRGTPEHNIELSKARAASVVAYLSDSGIPSALLTSSGKSYFQPAGFNTDQSMDVVRNANKTVEQMAANRRVQLFIKTRSASR